MSKKSYNKDEMIKDYIFINKILPYDVEEDDGADITEKQKGKEEYNIIAMGTTFNNADRVGDVIDSNAFNSSIKAINEGRKLKILFSHKRDKAIGNWTKAVKTAQGIKLFGKISDATQETRDLLALVKDGVYDKVSIGFIAKEIEELKEGYKIMKGELVECSVVAIPANNNADILNIKDYDVMMNADTESVEEVNHYNKDDGIEFNNFIKRLESNIFKHRR